MDPQTDLPDLVEDLEVNIDELSGTLEPLLATPLHTTASSLPLLDKAKFYVLAAYTIESLVFSALKASGVDVAEHAIFKEIARLKGYNGKIKDIEERGLSGSAEGRRRLDVGAAARFIKHGLAGNDKYDLERAERIAKEKARAHLKALKLNKKFDEEGKAIESDGVTPKKRGVDDMVEGNKDSDEVILGGEDEEIISGLDEAAEPVAKKARVEAAKPTDMDSEPVPSSQSSSKKRKKAKKSKPTKNVNHNSADTTPMDGEDQQALQPSNPPEEPTQPQPHPKKRGRPTKKERKQAQQAEAEAQDTTPPPSKHEARVTRTRNRRLSTLNDDAEEEAVVPANTRAPKTRSETFNALLDGSMAERQHRKGKGGKNKGKT
ncbi:hypothetical protein BDW02DRAFT_571680 [Decorospora gaudefroyi]|uniref:Exosome complex protein n=1 Tax=Decorospora gaudefroyi TaxID=184978 RepID=A0A6A5K4Z4_9PLEO|nr:hypothetical protein BDW02DRAFT_571680 [Decorospora gaudefroyi]